MSGHRQTEAKTKAARVIVDGLNEWMDRIEARLTALERRRALKPPTAPPA